MVLDRLSFEGALEAFNLQPIGNVTVHRQIDHQQKAVNGRCKNRFIRIFFDSSLRTELNESKALITSL